MCFLDFANNLNYNLKETELEEERLFIKNNKVQRVKESKDLDKQNKKDVDEDLTR